MLGHSVSEGGVASGPSGAVLEVMPQDLHYQGMTVGLNTSSAKAMGSPPRVVRGVDLTSERGVEARVVAADYRNGRHATLVG